MLRYIRNIMVTNLALSVESDDLVFAALADATRRRVLTLLRQQPRAVHHMSEMFSISRPAVSRHLRVLRDAGLVRIDKQGTENIYVLETERLRVAEGWLQQFWGGRLNSLKTLAEGSWSPNDG